MTETPTFHGALQASLMRVLWTTGGGTVQMVRDALPPDDQHAYTTIQTVLNRLAERGLVEREKRGGETRGPVFAYRPAVTEHEYVSATIGRVLSDASPSVRDAALAQLVSGLDPRELRKLEGLAADVDRRRAKKGR